MSGQEREALRAEFEAWAHENTGVDLETDGHGNFMRIAAHQLWAAWQAARAAQPAAGAEDICPGCLGSGEGSVLSGGGPDAYDVPCQCQTCSGSGVIGRAPDDYSHGHPNDWQEALRERFATYCVGMPAGHSPTAALKALIDWEVSVALDPQVSAAAQALVDSGRQQAVPQGWREVLKRARQSVSAGSRSVSDMDAEQAIAFPLLDHIEDQLEALTAPHAPTDERSPWERLDSIFSNGERLQGCPICGHLEDREGIAECPGIKERP